MNTVHIRETYGPILGMDQMCDGTIPSDLSIGDQLVRHSEGTESILVTVAALQAQFDADGEIKDTVGIGLRGPDAHLVKPGDKLTIVSGAEEE